MPVDHHKFEYNYFPPFFDGLLPEGIQLEALIRQMKIDKYDYFSQLIQVGKDLVGSVTVEGVTE
jgi:serine/threonine-protein kinase HipA